jgi:hypothetical protein
LPGRTSYRYAAAMNFFQLFRIFFTWQSRTRRIVQIPVHCAGMATARSVGAGCREYRQRGFATGETEFRGQFARQQSQAADVRFGSKADIGLPVIDVRYSPKSGHQLSALGCPLCAKSGHYALQQSTSAASASNCEFSPVVGVGCKAWVQSHCSQPLGPSALPHLAHRR